MSPQPLRRFDVSLVTTQCKIKLTFQSGKKRTSKWSWSGRKGATRPMLCLSKAYNVISCKKKSKLLILLCFFGLDSLALNTFRSENIPKVVQIFWSFSGFFWSKFNFLAKQSTFALSMSYIAFLESFWFSGQFELSWKIFSASCDASDFYQLSLTDV